MANDNKSSPSIIGLDAQPIVRPLSFLHGGTPVVFSGVVSVADDADIGSVYRFFRVKSSMRPSSLRLFCGTLTAGAGNIGLHRIAAEGGAVVDADFFASAQSIATASAVGIECVYEAANAASNMGIGVMDKRIWEVMGLALDPALEYDVTITLTAQVTDPGFLGLAGSFVQ